MGKLKLHLVTLLSILVINVLTFAQVAPAQASTRDISVSKEIVLVEKDNTANTKCSYIVDYNTGTQAETKTTTKCNVGTILQPTYLLLSLAQVQHLPYIKLPTTEEERSSFPGKLKALEEQTRNTLGLSSPSGNTSKTIHPYSCRGSSSNYSEVLFYPTSSYYLDIIVNYSYENCSQVHIGTSTFYSSGGPFEWNGEAYAGTVWQICQSWSGNGSVTTSSTPSYNTEGQGYYAVNYYEANNLNHCDNPYVYPASSNVSSVSIGPLFA